MGFEELPLSEQKKGAPKKETTLYAPFQKEQHKKNIEGVRIDVKVKEKEEQIVLSELEGEIEKGTGKEYEKLLERFVALSDRLQKGKLWTKVNVSGETHIISFMTLESQGKPKGIKELYERIKKEPRGVEDVTANFSLKKTEGRPEHLFLSFKTPLKLLLQGGGEIENELEKLITRQFAGTKHYYETLRQKQMELPEKPKEKEEFETGKKQIQRALQKKGAIISEIEGGGFYGIVAQFPNEERQIHISSVDKTLWNVTEVENQKTEREQFNLRPQEVIAQYLEKAYE